MTTTTSKITTTIVDVTPEMAEQWLQLCNIGNRNLSVNKANGYAREMVEGRWHFNGEAIQFDTAGMLLNGQHRLLAIVTSDTTQTFLVVQGLNRTSQVTMDQGNRRSPTDQLKVVGVDVHTSVAAAIRICLQWESGRLFGDAKRIKVTTGEIVQWANDNKDSLDLLNSLPLTALSKIPVKPSITYAVALRLYEIDVEDAAQFFELLSTGAGLAKDSPILALRNRFTRISIDRTFLPTRDVIAYYIRAWNGFRTNESMAKLQRPVGARWSISNFPVPK
jgi:hypothetical protein